VAPRVEKSTPQLEQPQLRFPRSRARPATTFAPRLCSSTLKFFPMSTLPVLADASSRLLADIAMVRLIRARIPKDRISAIFPQRRAPNSACCWLKGFSVVPRAHGMGIAAAGILGGVFRRGFEAPRVQRGLEALGLRPDFTERAVEKVAGGQIMLCVHARSETEAAIAWHIFHHVGAENIALADAPSHASALGAPALAPQWIGLAA
jgi:hypothetical protein